jgi:type I restriction enzyme S subunit
MTDWPVKTLGDVAKWGSGGTPLSGVAEYYGGNIPWCVIGDLTESDVWKTEKSITEEGLANSSAKIVEVGAILIAMYGASIGRTGVVRLKMATNQAIAFAYANEEVICSDYLLKYLQSQKSAFNGAGHGSAQPNISQQVLKGWPIPVPSLEEQKRIVALLDAATARVTELTACYEQARTHANNLFTSALRDALESNPDWPIRTLGQVATFHNGRAYKQQELLDKGKYRVLRVGNFFSSKSWYWSDLELDEHKYCDKGDLLYAWSASFGPRIWDEEKVIYHYHIWKVVEESQQINRQFLKYWLEEDVERVKSASGTGTTMMHVSKGSIEARLISLPPLEEQKQIVARLDSMRAKTSEMVAAYDAKLQAAKNLRQSVLEAAFAGEL